MGFPDTSVPGGIRVGAGAALAVTAVFQLARRRIQRVVVARRFNRRRCDAD